MKVVAFNGSPRMDGNTAILIKKVFEELEKENIQTELVQLSGKTIHGCRACHKCFNNKDGRCAHQDDLISECIIKMAGADGIILGSPTYFSDVTSEMKALIDRAGTVAKANDEMFKRKVGAAVVAVRRAGGIHVFNTMNLFFLINQMIIVGSNYWNLGFGFDIGEVQKDAEGLKTMQILGQNISWLLKKLKKN